MAVTVSPQSLSHCELITDDGIRHLGSGPCAHDRLEVIELDNCPLITDASLEHLKSCHSLDRIELYDCQQITRAGIKRLRVGGDAEQLSLFLGRMFCKHYIVVRNLLQTFTLPTCFMTLRIILQNVFQTFHIHIEKKHICIYFKALPALSVWQLHIKALKPGIF